MKTLFRQPRARILAIVLVGAFAAGIVATRPQDAAAQRGAPVVPSGPLWCGITASGGSVNMQLSSDLRFVEWIDVQEDKGTISTREGPYTGVGRAQIADSKFIFRQQHPEEECERDRNQPGSRNAPTPRCNLAPCRPGASGGGRPSEPRPGERCNTVTIEDMSIRGTFLNPDSVRGSFAAQQVIDTTNTPGNGGRPIVRNRLLTGTYVAWPVGTAPCP